MNITAICQTLQYSELTTQVMALLVAQFNEELIKIDEHEVCQKYGAIDLTLSTPEAKEKCTLEVNDQSLYINPIKSMGDDRGDFKLNFDTSRSAEEWAKIAMVFIKDILWIGQNEFVFEVYDIEYELIHESFTTKSLIHAMYKTQNLHTLRDVDNDLIDEVLIIMDNDECESREIKFKPQDNFFNLTDRSLKTDDLILVLYYIKTLKKEASYCHRQNLKLGVEL